MSLFILACYSQARNTLLFSGVLDLYEGFHSTSLREKALQECYEHICADDAFTKGISIGPVSNIDQFSVNMYILSVILWCVIDFTVCGVTFVMCL